MPTALSETPTAKHTPTATGEDGKAWVRPGKLPRHGIELSRAHVYLLAERGEIEMVSLKPPGTKRGVALVNLASVHRFIERCRGLKSATTSAPEVCEVAA